MELFKLGREPDDWKKRFEFILTDSAVMKEYRANPDHNVLAKWLLACEIVSAERTGPKSGRLVVRFPVQTEYLNPNGTLQGGLQTAMYDVFTSWVFLFAPGWTAHVSSSLNTSYFRPAVPGEYILLENEVVNAGKNLGMSRGLLRREKDGAVISTCEHHKYNTTAPVAKI